MAFVTLAECKHQCNVLPEELEFNHWFNMAIPAADKAIETALNRKVYETQAELDADVDAPDTAIVISQDIKFAELMLIAHWFNNREATSALNLHNVPFSFDMLIQPHRCINI